MNRFRTKISLDTYIGRVYYNCFSSFYGPAGTGKIGDACKNSLNLMRVLIFGNQFLYFYNQ
jgi:hypothetical protein